MSNTDIHVIENDKYKLTIGYDLYYSEDIFEFNPDVIFLSNHRDYNSQNNDGLEIDDFENEDDLILRYKEDGMKVVKVNAYIHGNIALSESSFDCQFDSGMFGYLAYPTNQIGKGDMSVKGFLESWQSNLNGEIYEVLIELKNKCCSCGKFDYELLESCGGFNEYSFETIEDYIYNLDDDFIELVKKEIA